ncbi:MAG: sulfatase family protein [Planctomycetota bacterium]|jgi:arylsulfatase A-like enzyme
MAEKTNVLFILSDQHNAKVLSCKDHPDVKTPHLDRLACQGVRFENAITQNPICTPSRISFISGQYCHNHGYYGLSGPRPRGLPTIFGHFRKAGYRTGAFGKIHCPEYWVEDDCDVFRETCHCSIGGRSREYADYLEQRGLTEKEDHGRFHEFGSRGVQRVDGRASMVSYEDSQEGWSARKAAEFMRRSAEEGKPFFAHVSLPKPHQSYAPARRFWDLYEESKLALPPNAEYDMAAADKAPHLRAMAERWREGKWVLFEPRTFEAGRLRKLRGYLGNVSHVDHAVGELMAFLDEAGLAESTIVIYTSDHGDYACEQGQIEKAPGICSDAITRIPMIWRLPGRFKAACVAEEIVETVDMVPTLCALAGLEGLQTADGKDISHLLRGEGGEVHRVGVTEFAFSKSVRKGKWRLVYYPREFFADECPEGFGELYDLEADPWEMKNLYFDGDYADVVRELRDELLDWLVTTTRPATLLGAAVFTGDQAITRYRNTVNPDGRIHPDHVRAGLPGPYR